MTDTISVLPLCKYVTENSTIIKNSITTGESKITICKNMGNKKTGLCRKHRERPKFPCKTDECDGFSMKQNSKCISCRHLEETKIKLEKDSIKEKHRELKIQFMKLVEEMKSIDCKLPRKFELFYTITHHKDRRGEVVHIKPALTRSQALKNKKSSLLWIDKYDSYRESFVIDSETYVSTENFSTDNKTEYEADFKIE